MDHTERQIIDELFTKLRQAEAQSGPRDAEAEAHIRDQIARQPAAPYLMAQAIVMLEQALATAQTRTEELERQLRERPASTGGIFGGLFGGGPKPPPAPVPQRQAGSPWGQPATPSYGDPRVAAYANPNAMGATAMGRPGGGFMAGALQTAMGVAGGMLLGNALASAFSGGEAMAQEAVNEVLPPAEDTPPEEPAADEAGWDDGGFDDSGFDDI
ncbi:DUF2076 domain-containing protein [Rhodospirillum centenum]|uniref:Periplasmic ligand-binding sensor protein n=1 Tax=Rhodospirillum centenum (strain ATCC 51521 / SW) TaxID=414684 RepID=B6ISJ4_RHOCS|nr:DUF2076 domain-containing protein [Rhodospirillum centenum]ACI98430.1 conserved hypothetical protein [Rhodospirillum centenum SW]